MNDEIYTNDCLEQLPELDANSVHAIVTDPPYGLAFMGRSWDDFEPKEYQAWCEKWATECLRVLKPGGHLLAFSGNRTHHRLMSGIEDAGYEIRDTITWHYGCLSEDTEVLTSDGWKKHDEIERGDSVMAFDPDTEQFNIEETNRVFRYDHDGSMIRYQSAYTDQLVTPNHRVLHRQNGEWKTTYAAHSCDNMELPVIHASTKVRLSSGKDLSNLLLGVGSDYIEGSREQKNMFTQMCKRNAGVETARHVKGTREQTTRKTRRYDGSDVCEVWEGTLDTGRQSGRKQLLFPRMLSTVAKRRCGYVRPSTGNSTQGRNVRRSAGTTVAANEWGKQPRLERGRDRKEAERQLQARKTGSVSRRVFGNGAVKRLCARTSAESSKRDRTTTHVGGSGTSQRPRQSQQRYRKSGTVSQQPTAQTRRGESREVSVGTTVPRTTRVNYSGTVWCVQVPSSYFVARRNGQVFITGNSGFPKALDVSKAIDKQADAEREVVGKKAGYSPNRDYSENQHEGYQRPADERNPTGSHYDKTEPATEQAKQWDGFKSALKPATEFVCVARSPLAEDTIAENVVAHGTGALNIDATRIETDEELTGGTSPDSPPRESDLTGDERTDSGKGMFATGTNPNIEPTEGRYPSNLVFDEKQADVLDDEVGETESGYRENTANVTISDDDVTGGFGMDYNRGERGYKDEGGPSRYFYTSKASKAERTLDGKIDNAHPTVKPIDLMEWLVSLATAEEQIVLDPFAGSGTTCKAAKNKNRQFIGIEQQAKWADVARVRSGLPPDDHSHIRSDDEQHGLEQF